MTIAVATIDGYQRWISPRKGFRCAHGALHGTGGCSGFGKRAFARHPTLMAWALLRRRLAACREAYTVLSMSYADERRDERRRAAADACTDFSCSGADLACDVGSCGN